MLDDATRSPWRSWLLALAALLALLVACFPGSVAGRTAVDGASRLTFEDALYQPPVPLPPNPLQDPSTETLHQPWDVWIIRSMKAGELPLWLPDNGMGAPLLANGQSAPFSPYKWLTLGFTDGRWTTAFVLGRLALAGAGVLLLARTFGLSAAAGLLGAAAFMLHAFFLHHLRLPDVHVYVFMPWLLLAAERLRRAPDARGIGLMGLALGVTGLLGHPEPALYAATGVGLAYAAAAWRAGEGRGRRAAAMLAAIGLGALLTAAVTLPFAEFVRESRSYLFEHPEHFSTFTFKHLVVFVTSHLLVPEGPRALYDPFVGVAPLALAVLGLRHAVRVPALALVGTGALIYLLFPPTNVIPALPVAPNSFYAPPLIALGLALLAAAGLDALLAAPRARGPLAVAAGAALVALMVAAYQLAAPFKLLGDLGSALPFLAATALVLGAQRFRAWPRPALAGAMLALTATHLALAVRLVVHPMAPFAYPETPLITHLKAQPGGYRVVGGARALMPDTNLMHGIPSAEHHDAFYLRRYLDFWLVAAGGLLTTGYQPALLDLANVRWVLVPEDRISAPLRAQVARDPARYPLVARQPRVALHENTTVLPRARVLHRARFVPHGSPDAVRLLAASPAAWREVALVETPDGAPLPGWVDQPGPATPATITAYAPHHVEVQATLARPGVLVLADMIATGWRAEVDGRPAAILPVDVAFRGVALAAGAHRVVFRYEPRAVAVGLALSLLALGACLLAIAWPARRRPDAAAGEAGQAESEAGSPAGEAS